MGKKTALLGRGRRLLRRTSTEQSDIVKAPKAKARALTMTEKTTLQTMVEHFENNPDQICPEYCRITSSASEAKMAKVGRDPTSWNDTYCYWRSISKAWISNLVAELGSDFGVTEKLLDQIDHHDQTALWNIYETIFGFRKEELFPRPCIKQAVMRDWLIEMAKMMGNRVKLLAACVDPDTGAMDWARWSPYQFVKTDDRVSHIKHDIVNANPDTPLNDVGGHALDGTWDMTSLWSDRGAQIKKRMMKPLLIEFLTEPQQEALLALFDSNKRNEVAKKIGADHKTKQANLIKLEKESLVSGKEAIAAKKAESAKKRKGPSAPASIALHVVDQGSASSSSAVAPPAVAPEAAATAE
mmetsp:Transcript_54800/g.138439  ORF Transcript_54800/g.138439 Transcript_54800/m.138439 type:complete len:355 (-) Transcript_54800:129-1193(-)|eukprot:CAMPEP_0115217022 /NCGR_PEP_ID=MMETSP0270-20121206/25646_1 /TAXON_ID=71861 /ORGANISM="Scrippsiella trochoidea, Strain CCMP3099" /LENGTH=354 /DNA_ID=CAMNT_0002630891 /DNA_START=64 /DNA_END=1128 /DNA_ORIENTATION=-